MDKQSLLSLFVEDQDSICVEVLRDLKIDMHEDLDAATIKMGIFHNLLLKEYIEKKEK